MKSNIPNIANQISPIFKYNLQFSYLKRKHNLGKRKNVPSCFNRSASRDFQANNQSVVSCLHQSIPITDDRVALKSLSLSFDKKEKNNYFLSQRKEQSQIIPQNFPKRKQKTKELHLFKMLKKYTEESRYIEEQKLKIKLFEKQNETFAGIKPHLKIKPKEAVLKQRYCLNREKKQQTFLQMLEMDPGKSLFNIKVNSLKRNI